MSKNGQVAQKRKLESTVVAEIQNFSQSVNNLEFKMKDVNKSDLDQLIYDGKMAMNKVNKVLKTSEAQDSAKPNNSVKLAVFKLIVEKIISNQATDQILFSENITIFERYFEKNKITSRTIRTITQKVLRLQVMYLQLLMDYINNVESDAVKNQKQLSLYLISFAKNVFFTFEDLFPPFYYAIKNLVNLIKEKRQKVESVWSSLLKITLELLKASTPSSSSMFVCNTGTAFLLVIFVSKIWFNLAFNSDYSQMDTPVQTIECSNLIAKLNQFFCNSYHYSVSVCPVEEVIKLFYPFLVYSHEEEKKDNHYCCELLVLSHDCVLKLLYELSSMNPNCHNQLQCAYFQMAFNSMHYHLVWNQLKRQHLSTYDAKFLKTYKFLEKVFSSWKDSFEMMSTAQTIPFTNDLNQQELYWFKVEPKLVIKLLITLRSLVEKYVAIARKTSNTEVENELKHLSKTTMFFDRFELRQENQCLLDSIKGLIK